MICSSVKKIKSENVLRVGVRLSFNDEELFSRFGIEFSKSNFKKILLMTKSVGIKTLSCIHIHYPKRDIDSFYLRIEKLFQILKEIKQDLDLEKVVIDIGGGFPSEMHSQVQNYMLNNNLPNIAEYSLRFKELINKYKFNSLRFFVEPGTALAANCLMMLGNIHSINEKSHGIFLNTDLSRTLLGGLKNEVPYPFVIINKKSDKEKENTFSKKYNLCSYSCVEGDIISSPLRQMKL